MGGCMNPSVFMSIQCLQQRQDRTRRASEQSKRGLEGDDVLAMRMRQRET